MSIFFSGVARGAAIVTLCAAIGAASVASANPIKTSKPEQSRNQPQLVVFNWLSPAQSVGKPIRRASPTKTGYIGRGSYICSPAGFGQRSKCFSR